MGARGGIVMKSSALCSFKSFRLPNNAHCKLFSQFHNSLFISTD